MFEDIKGKLAVVTGANRGLGKGVALGYAKAGVNVVIIDLQVSDETIKEITDCGVACYAYNYNLTDIDGIPALVEKITAECGEIDILYNNAGTQKRHPCTEFPKSDWDLVMDVNANSVFFLCQAVGRHMIKRGHGKIINTASMLSFQGGFTVPAYAASKGAVMQFTKSLSNEWAQHGINVNCIAPGYMATDLNTALINDPNRSRQILDRIPAARWGQPADIAGTALFLASSASDYINGIVIPVDGGWLGR